MKKIKFNQELWDKYFEASTTIKEVTMEFASGELNKTQWIEMLYGNSKDFAKKFLMQVGEKNARKEIGKVLTEMWGHNEW